jgi:hypothetical protein
MTVCVVAGILFSGGCISQLNFYIIFIFILLKPDFRMQLCFILASSIFFAFKVFEIIRYTRTGVRLLLLPQISRYLPRIFIDGEIWYYSTLG